MERSKKFKILKSVCIAGASLCAAGILAGFTVGCVGASYRDKANELAMKNGYDIANANVKAEQIKIYTEMYNQGLMSDDDYRREIRNPKGISLDTFMFESDLPEEVKAEYSSLREKQACLEPAFATAAGTIPLCILIGSAIGYDEDYKKAKYERKQEKASKIFVDDHIKL